MSNRSKLYRSRAELFDRALRYPLDKAFDILKTMAHAKFDESVDAAFKLTIDPKQSDQNVRGAVPLPKGTGKSVRITVIADGPQAEAARKAGADFVGMEDLIDKIKEGWLDFDILIATPAAMAKIRPLGRVLGPRGLMPNPKTGTLTDQVGEAVVEAKAGRVEFRNDRGGCIHVPIGKISFASADLVENFNAVLHALLRLKPASAKGVYIQSCTVSSTMSPGIRVDTREFTKV
jgi:large subunit ribosomal protein L1